MLLKGNSKLGDIYTFSLPAGESCPGESETCGEKCYAKSGFFRMPSVKISQSRAMEVSKQPDFAERVIQFIRRFHIEIVRIHAAGDFYSAAYTKKWYQIISKCSKTQFYAYTRSWRNIPEVTPATRKATYSLSTLDNMVLWLSCDKSTGCPPAWEGCPWAYLAVDDDDIPNYIPSLVFRDNDRDILRRQFETNALVCPLEQGVDLPLTTCNSCRICFNKKGKVLKELYEAA